LNNKDKLVKFDISKTILPIADWVFLPNPDRHNIKDKNEFVEATAKYENIFSDSDGETLPIIHPGYNLAISYRRFKDVNNYLDFNTDIGDINPSRIPKLAGIFDNIYCIDILPYIKNVYTYLESIFIMCKPNGSLRIFSINSPVDLFGEYDKILYEKSYDKDIVEWKDSIIEIKDSVFNTYTNYQISSLAKQIGFIVDICDDDKIILRKPYFVSASMDRIQ
jgi:hypothetical protein